MPTSLLIAPTDFQTFLRPCFGRSVNPILKRGDRLCHIIINCPPRIFRPSYGPANGNFSTTNGYLYDSTVVLLIFAHKLLKSTRLPVFANFTNNRKMIKQVLLVQQPLYFLPKLYIPNNINQKSNPAVLSLEFDIWLMFRLLFISFW